MQAKIGQLQRRYSLRDSTSRSSNNTELCNGIMSVTKYSILGALNADTQNSMPELLTLPCVIIHAPINTTAESSTSESSSSATQAGYCNLCGNELHQSSKSFVCLVCETQAFILFSFGLALSSPSQRACKMKLHDVLVPEGTVCLIPEWSSKQRENEVLSSSLRSEIYVEESGFSSCNCAFCTILVSECEEDMNNYHERCRNLISKLMQSTSEQLSEMTRKDYSWLRIFKRSRQTGQLLWNDFLDSKQLEEQGRCLDEIVKFFLPSVHTATNALKWMVESDMNTLPVSPGLKYIHAMLSNVDSSGEHEMQPQLKSVILNGTRLVVLFCLRRYLLFSMMMSKSETLDKGKQPPPDL